MVLSVSMVSVDSLTRRAAVANTGIGDGLPHRSAPLRRFPRARGTHNELAMRQKAAGLGMAGGAALALAFTGCATPFTYSRPSSGQIAAAETAVSAARRAGADQDQQASPFL